MYCALQMIVNIDLTAEFGYTIKEGENLYGR
jgi:hypothetical protein